MDPNQCLEDLAHYLNVEDGPGAKESAGNLLHWVISGGFLPDVDRHHLIELLRFVESRS